MIQNKMYIKTEEEILEATGVDLLNKEWNEIKKELKINKFLNTVIEDLKMLEEKIKQLFDKSSEIKEITFEVIPIVKKDKALDDTKKAILIEAQCIEKIAKEINKIFSNTYKRVINSNSEVSYLSQAETSVLIQVLELMDIYNVYFLNFIKDNTYLIKNIQDSKETAKTDKIVSIIKELCDISNFTEDINLIMRNLAKQIIVYVK